MVDDWLEQMGQGRLEVLPYEAVYWFDPPPLWGVGTFSMSISNDFTVPKAFLIDRWMGDGFMHGYIMHMYVGIVGQFLDG